jgi:N6-L-threonylcarbamoyladenine synthase
LPYPGGPLIDKFAREGDPQAWNFSKGVVKGLDFSFSGLKTSFLYFLKDHLRNDKDFISHHMEDLCASIQRAIIDSLAQKLVKAAKETGINEIAIAGGVSANSGLRNEVHTLARQKKWNVYIPEIQFATDNAAMIAITGYYKYINHQFSSHHIIPVARFDHL